MKKWQILIPSVMVASTPLIALTGCNKEEKIKFTLQEEPISTDGSTLSFMIYWKEKKHNLVFPKDALLTWPGYEVHLTVESILKGGALAIADSLAGVHDNIENAKLTITYNDLTTKTKNVKSYIKGINIAYLPVKK